MKTMLTRCFKASLGTALLFSLTALPAFGQEDPGLGPIDPASIADLLPDDEYAPKLTAACASGTCVVISWKGDGILQVSSGPNGPWKDLWNAASPFPVSLSESPLFFRARIPAADEVVPVDELVASPLDRFFADLAPLGNDLPRVTAE